MSNWPQALYCFGRVQQAAGSILAARTPWLPPTPDLVFISDWQPEHNPCAATAMGLTCLLFASRHCGVHRPHVLRVTRGDPTRVTPSASTVGNGTIAADPVRVASCGTSCQNRQYALG